VYEHFSDHARKVMHLANLEAQRLNHDYVGTEHILLGLVKEGNGLAATVLGNLGLELRIIRLEVERSVGAGPDRITQNKLPQTPRVAKVIEHARDEARNLNQEYVGTEHLLLGLLREEEGVAAQVLKALGVGLALVRRALDAVATVEQVASQPATGAAAPAVAEDLDAEIERLTRAKEGALAVGDYEKAAQLLGQANELKEQRGLAERWDVLDTPPTATLVAPEPTSAEVVLYERFTGQARRVMLLAHREAHRFSHDYLGTEHVLLGVLQENFGSIGRLLAAFAVDIVQVRQEIEKTVRQGATATVGARLPLTPPCRRALQFAREEAARLRHDNVGPEHLLLGLLHEPDSEATQVLLGLGLDLERLREEALKLPPPENRDTMLQPEPKPGGAVAPDPSPRTVAELVTADLGVGGPARKEPKRKQVRATPLLSNYRDGLALQLRVTQHTLGALVGMIVGALLAGPGGAVLGVLGGLALAAVRKRGLAIPVAVGLGLILGFRYSPTSLATHLIMVLAGILVGVCLGEPWRSYDDDDSAEDEENAKLT